MSLLLASLIVALIAVAALVAVSWYAFAREDLERLRQYEHWYNRFARGARLLTEDARVPKDFVKLLSDLNRLTQSKGAAYALYQGYRNPGPAPALVSTTEDGISFYENDHELAKLVGETLNSGVMATTYTSVIWGEKARNAMARSRGGENNIIELTVAARKIIRDDQDLPPTLVAA